MIPRELHREILELLGQAAAVVLTGPRQAGKTTIATAIASELKGVYRDLENPGDREQVEHIELLIDQYPDNLIVLDEVQRAPNLFERLRGIIDRRRREGFRHGQFLLLGSASLELLGQTSESLAGRVSYTELAGINLAESRNSTTTQISDSQLWLKGGLPESHLAVDESASIRWREDLIRSYLERDVAQFGFRVPAETMRRFWTMLAHRQGSLFNAAAIAKALGVSGQSVARYLDIMVDLLLVRRLPPWFANVGKRLVKSPKVYVRDSGLLHALLDVTSIEQLLSHPVAGYSWEGFVIENLIDPGGPHRYQPYFFRSQRGAEIDLLLVRGGVPEVAIEVKRSSNPKPEKGFLIAADDLRVKHRYLAYPGDRAYQLPDGIWAAPPIDVLSALRTRKGMSFS